MDEQTFASALQEYSVLEEELHHRLLVLSPKMNSELREKIIHELEEAAKKENAILEEAIRALEGIEHQVKKEVRQGEENREHTEEMTHLPNFDS